MKSVSRGIVFIIVLLTAGLAAGLWRSTGAGPSPGNSRRGLTWRWWWNTLRAFGLALVAGALVILIVQLAWGLEWEIWLFAGFWIAALFGLMILSGAMIIPMLLPRDPWGEQDHA